jgi:multisubunit Na+/H+ antiporter MnhE subunit
MERCLGPRGGFGVEADSLAPESPWFHGFQRVLRLNVRPGGRVHSSVYGLRLAANPNVGKSLHDGRGGVTLTRTLSSSAQNPVRHKLSVRPFFSAWLAGWVAWLVLADNSGWREMLAGAASSAIAIVAVAVFLLRSRVTFSIRAKFLKEAVHVPKQLAADTWLLLLTIVRRVAGSRPASGVMAVPFRRGGNGPSSRARRALAITYLTVTPNTLVLGISEDKRIFLFHAIAPRPLPSFMTRLGAHPESEA